MQTETLIDRFLAEQVEPTAVERFSRHYEENAGHALAPSYRALMPATPPGPGQQYAFQVDLDACTGCKACVTACCGLNGLGENETWRSVGLLVGAADGPQHVTTACHHCAEPGCLSGCPVDAYEKDPRTGIVQHLDDQCIGCGYCLFTCPYEVPRYNRELGIVRKCDMCADRLAADEAPACVQACPTHAISIQIVDVRQVSQAAREPWPIAAPDPSRTVPTTTYLTERDLTAAEAADLHVAGPAHSHPPLALMLVLTQFAVGTYLIDLLMAWRGRDAVATVAAAPSALLGLGVALVALGASVLHLGRPRYAYRAVIGLRHSWLSREIVAFGAFAGLAAVQAGAVLGGLSHPILERVLPLVVGATGVTGVLCSVLIYAVTGRRWWRARTTGIRFGLTTVAGGLSMVLTSTTVAAWLSGAETIPVAAALAGALALTTVLKLAVEASILRHVRGPATSELARTARLLIGPLAPSTWWRVGLGLPGGVVIPALAVHLSVGGTGGLAAPALLSGAGLILLCAGELVERWQFFTAVSARRMPGGVP